MKRVLSMYEMSFNNLMLYIFYLITKITFAYFTLKQIHKFFYYIFRKLEKTKKIKLFSLFADVFFLLLNLFELCLIFYIINLISFNNLRQTIFEIVNFNFSTNSNLRDLDSFKIFYCFENSSYYRDYNNNNDNKINQNFDENSKYNGDETTYIINLKSFLCFKCNFLDGFYLEYFLIFLIISNMVYKNIRSYYDKNYKGFSCFYKVYFFLLASLQLIYFIYVYLGISYLRKEANNKGKNKPNHQEIDHDNYKMDDISAYKEYTYFDDGNSNNEIGNENNEMITHDPEVSDQKFSIWNFLGEVIEFLLEILAD